MKRGGSVSEVDISDLFPFGYAIVTEPELSKTQDNDFICMILFL